ncbi:tetratricopeptide repeat protein [Afifella pfennigii]|uniref:tetratricopeptide repeat protein n=1 Tax=Afifella pfennigii TaxID=209897 RepID=UPI00068EC7D0|nr:tetratricopeptide repeat protein [Afifella pfennigii]
MRLSSTRHSFRHRVGAGLLIATLALASAGAGAGGAAFAKTADGDDRIDLSSFAGTLLAARAADDSKDIVRGARFYRKAYQSDPSNPLWLERAVVLTTAEGDIRTALPLARDLVKQASDSQIASFILVTDLIRRERYREALERLRETDNGALAALTSGLLTAWSQYAVGEGETALATIEALEGETWYEPFKLLHGGFIANLLGDKEAALAKFGKAFERDEGAVRIVEAYARQLARNGERDKAQEVLEEFLERFPDNALAAQTIEEIAAGGEVRQAINGPQEGAAEAFSGIGAAIGQEGGFELAAVYLRLALHLDPASGGGLAALSLGNLFDVNGLGDQAIAVLQAIPKNAPFRPLGTLRSAIVLDREDRVEQARNAFEEAIRRNPEDIQAYVAYGNMQRGREKYEAAAEIYSQAIAKVEEPARNDWTLFYFRGIAYERSKQWPKAEADFKTALELYPDQPLVLNYLGYSWVDMGMHLEEALEMIKKAVELRPNDGFIVDSLGWAYYRLGRYEEAVEELEQAVALQPSDPVINDHLGDAYWKTGRKLEAQFQWRHARDLGAKLPELEVINRKIAAEALVETAPRVDVKPEGEKDSSFRHTDDARHAGISEREETYVVRPGDSLWEIANRLFGNGPAYLAILEANRDILSNANALRPGMRLKIPGEL